ncbi:LLM class flavin-dependent oxidoreductase, partial [Pseudomonadales bacterium]|nr:LLM class flavin-dependent oxidoreductase [Pseudomonadales bacterium]
MKLAVTAWDLSSVEALQRIPDQAAKAEAMGFEGFWLPENHFAGPAALSAPLILLAAAAARTSTIDL